MTISFQPGKTSPSWSSNMLSRLTDLKNSVCNALSRPTTHKMASKDASTKYKASTEY